MTSVLMIAAVSACRAAPEQHAGGDSAPGARDLAPLAARPASTEPSASIKTKMQGHYDDAQTMRRAITIGDVVTLKTVAADLASDRWLPFLSAEWAAPLADVRAAASRASEVTSVEAGAGALAALGTACAACHQTMAGPLPAPAVSPPAGVEEPLMFTHQAAVEDLWAGLITPDAEAWRRGSRALAGGSFVASSREGERAARELEDVARQSIEAPRERWEELMAKSLVTCAQCHRLHGVGVASPSGGDVR